MTDDPAVDDLAARLVAGRADASPWLVGLAGAVSVGKTTLAGQLVERWAAMGLSATVVTTDHFLLPNVALADRGLSMRKGFPETFDLDALAWALKTLKAGERVATSRYSHLVYDIVEGDELVVVPADVVLVEGVVALQPPPVDHLDTTVYLDAAEPDVVGWYVDRFERLCAEATGEPESFYAPFAALTEAERDALARGTWDAINAPNLHEHIEATRQRASFVVHKGADHRIVHITSPA
ncbi:MAG TPA: hypothetical protein VM618_12350 [Acidimicrobiia bacterium]|nr:hypothetical protein [Acidimicrobiia bacterium]